MSVSNIDHYKSGNKKVTDSAHYLSASSLASNKKAPVRIAQTKVSTELERQIEFSESVGDDDDSALGYSADIAISRQVGIGRGTDGLARLTLEDSFSWKEFETLYYDSDLFKWHRQEYLGESGAPNLDEMKRIWMDNERNYEKSFLEGARRRIQQDGSRNAKKGPFKIGMIDARV
ncbi:hypothetical protein BGZ98_003774 [Dissophora globulifera]|nr:hypothetical protein BGZ98_003774 [Dissophora globulifera]